MPIIGPEKGLFIAEIIRKVKSKRVLEVGTLMGYKAILMGKEMGSDPQMIILRFTRKKQKPPRKHNKSSYTRKI